MVEYNYNSILSPFIMGLMEEKHAHGHESKYLWFELLHIDKYVCNHPTSVEVSEAYYEQWMEHIDDGNLSRKTLYRKISCFRQLLEHMKHIGIDCYVPRLPRENEHKFIPYIYSHDEVERIFLASDEQTIRNEINRTCLMPIPAIIRLLYSTGMRLGEALKLRNKDVDFNRYILLLVDTKNRHQRICPINQSLEVVLKQYLEYRNKLPLSHLEDDESPLFVTRQGLPVDRSGVERWFRNILKKAQIPYIGHFAGPRVHDLRHTACVHAMVKLCNEGMDLQCALPVLSKFLGHLNPYFTERYLRLTQEMYPDIIHKANKELPEIEAIIKRACRKEVWDEDE